MPYSCVALTHSATSLLTAAELPGRVPKVPPDVLGVHARQVLGSQGLLHCRAH